MIRRECLDHVIVWNARGLRRVLNALRRLLPTVANSLDKDSPERACRA